MQRILEDGRCPGEWTIADYKLKDAYFRMMYAKEAELDKPNENLLCEYSEEIADCNEMLYVLRREG